MQNQKLLRFNTSTTRTLIVCQWRLQTATLLCMSTEEIFFLNILKPSLQNYQIILKQCFSFLIVVSDNKQINKYIINYLVFIGLILSSPGYRDWLICIERMTICLSSNEPIAVQKRLSGYYRYVHVNMLLINAYTC